MERQEPGVLFGWTAAVALGLTVVVLVQPYGGGAVSSPMLRVAFETANAVVALLVAFLVYGRFRRSGRAQELLLVLGLCAVAVGNLALTALPSASVQTADLTRWAALPVRLLGTLLVATAALTPWAVRWGRRATRVAVLAAVGALLVVGALGALWSRSLLNGIAPVPGSGVLTGYDLGDEWTVVGAQLLGAALYGIAALALLRQARAREDELIRWMAAGFVLAAVARVHYGLFPSLYLDDVYTGDLLRLGFYAYLLVGATREIRAYWELRARTAVLEDRRRMARDLHDGLAQELSYIRAQSQRLTARPDDVHVVHRIQAAAGRATAEARRAISALSRPVGESFPAALRRQLAEASHRHDLEVVTDLDDRVDVDAAQDEALLRIASEAVHNAVRHGAASRIEVELSADPPCLLVRDDGRGFDTATAHGGGFGLTSMRERAAGFGGSLTVTSAPGEGTTVRVMWS